MTKRRTIEISLQGTETVEHYASAIIEVPADATNEEIELLNAYEIEALLCDQCVPPSWEADESNGIEADRVFFEGDVAKSPELRLIRDEDGSLIPMPNHIEEQLAS